MSLKKRLKLFNNIDNLAVVEKRKITKEGMPDKEIDVIVFPLEWYNELKGECVR